MRYRTILTAAAVPATLAAVLFGTTGAASAAANGQNGTTLSETVTATAGQRTVYDWTLTKTVDHRALEIWQGGSASAHYNVHAEKTAEPGGGADITGKVTITNGGSVATTDLASKLIVTAPPSQTALASTPVDLDTHLHPVLAPGETEDYPFTITLATPPAAGSAIKVTAATTISNHSGHLGGPFGPSGSWSGTYAGQVKVNDTLKVTDTNGMSWTFAGTGDQGYDQTFTDADAGPNPNTVTATTDDGKQLSSSAEVDVTVDSLAITKTTDHTDLTRTYRWQVGGQDQDLKVTVPAGQTSGQATYQVPVTVTSTDSGWAANGTITITNPKTNGLTAHITDVSDLLKGAQITDAPAFPADLAPGDSLILHWHADLGSADPATNTATVTIDTGAKWSASAPVSFDGAQVHTVGDTATIHNHAEVQGGDSSSDFNVAGQLDQG